MGGTAHHAAPSPPAIRRDVTGRWRPRFAFYCTVIEVLPLTPSRRAVMVALPRRLVRARPWRFTATTRLGVLFHETCVVTSSSEPSLKVPVAASCTFCFAAAVAFAGVMASALSVALVAVKSVEPVKPLRTAETVAAPESSDELQPRLPEAFETLTTAVFDDVHSTCEVRSSVEPSLKPPMARSCSLKPTATRGAAGETLMPVSTAEVTVIVAALEAPLRVAVRVAVPGATPVARPCEPAALEIVATAGAELTHVACEVTSSVVPSLYVPIAVNCQLKPCAMVMAWGVTAIEVSEAAVTVTIDT